MAEQCPGITLSALSNHWDITTDGKIYATVGAVSGYYTLNEIIAEAQKGIKSITKKLIQTTADLPPVVEIVPGLFVHLGDPGIHYHMDFIGTLETPYPFHPRGNVITSAGYLTIYKCTNGPAFINVAPGNALYLELLYCECTGAVINNLGAGFTCVGINNSSVSCDEWINTNDPTNTSAFLMRQTQLQNTNKLSTAHGSLLALNGFISRQYTAGFYINSNATVSFDSHNLTNVQVLTDSVFNFSGPVNGVRIVSATVYMHSVEPLFNVEASSSVGFGIVAEMLLPNGCEVPFAPGSKDQTDPFWSYRGSVRDLPNSAEIGFILGQPNTTATTITDFNFKKLTWPTLASSLQERFTDLDKVTELHVDNYMRSLIPRPTKGPVDLTCDAIILGGGSYPYELIVAKNGVPIEGAATTVTLDATIKTIIITAVTAVNNDDVFELYGRQISGSYRNILPSGGSLRLGTS